jgi:hypothetical protein
MTQIIIQWCLKEIDANVNIGSIINGHIGFFVNNVSQTLKNMSNKTKSYFKKEKDK